MTDPGRYVLAALLAAVAAHFVTVTLIPRVLTDAASGRIGAGGDNAWHIAPRVTEASRTVVRPSPDMQYSACVYDLGRGPVTLRVTPWDGYWSLSLYADNSDTYFVIDDREAHDGAEIILVRRGRAAPEDAARVVESPSQRGIALIRRLAPTPSRFDAAKQAAGGDVCATASR